MQKDFGIKRLKGFFTKFLLLALIFSMLLSLVSCNSDEGYYNDSPKGSTSKGSTSKGLKLQYEQGLVGRNLFNSQGSDVEIYFFDIDNIVSEDGTSFEPVEKIYADFARPADCYMIVCGTVEILVDGGFQTKASKAIVEKGCRNNLLPKIASLISDDGVLDYLIVTHADVDHIASLAYSNCIFDAFIGQAKITSIDGEKTVKLSHIKNIIDFDSNLVREYSDPNLTSESNLFLSSQPYKNYVEKRDILISRGKRIDESTSYIPAATLFDREDISSDNKKVSIPDDILEKPAGDRQANTKTPSLKRKFDLDEKNPFGKLVAVEIENADEGEDESKSEVMDKDADENEDEDEENVQDLNVRYFYEIPLSNDVKLRILYNWYYDHLFYHSFGTDDENNKFESQDRNNISVCFQVVSNNFKFLSLGDLGGSGENALLKYYEGTDVLENVTCFKASHHGSVYNKENSKGLFEMTNPRLIVITGVAWSKNSNVTNPSSPELTKDFFDNAPNNAYFLCTNILSAPKNKLSVPFYGDICVRVNGNDVKFAYSYVGDIEACLTNGKNQTFRVSDGGESNLKDTAWYKAIILELENESENKSNNKGEKE